MKFSLKTLFLAITLVAVLAFLSQNVGIHVFYDPYQRHNRHVALRRMVPPHWWVWVEWRGDEIVILNSDCIYIRGVYGERYVP